MSFRVLKLLLRLLIEVIPVLKIVPVSNLVLDVSKLVLDVLNEFQIVKIEFQSLQQELNEY